jgi:hypothetical protein
MEGNYSGIEHLKGTRNDELDNTPAQENKARNDKQTCSAEYSRRLVLQKI